MVLLKHHHRAEHWLVTQGNAKITLNKDIITKKPGEHIFIPLEAIHRVQNLVNSTVTPDPSEPKNQWWDFLDWFPNQSKQERALEAGKIEREENEWGPGGQPSASEQIKKSGKKGN